jgi:hypothetical protein
VVDVLDFVDGLSKWEIMLCSKLQSLSNNSFFFQIPLLLAIRLPQKSTFTTLIKAKVETPDFKNPPSHERRYFYVKYKRKRATFRLSSRVPLDYIYPSQGSTTQYISRKKTWG